MRRFKTVEELNMEVAVELTVEEKTQAFLEWVNQRLEVNENSLSIAVKQLERSLEQAEPLSDRMFNNKFELVYSFINDNVRTATYRCEEEQLSEDVLASTLAKFKELKNKAKKTKAEYKQKFVELKNAIAQAKEDEDYVNDIRSRVQDIVTDWCNTYVISDCYKRYFEGDELLRKVAHITDWILSMKLNPSDEDVVEHVEKYMQHYTETVAVVYDEVKRSKEYTACEIEVRRIRNSVSNLIYAVKSILEQMTSDDEASQLQLQYTDSLKKTMDIVVEDAEKLITKHNVTNEDEIVALKSMVTELMNDSLLLCSQG